MTVDPGRPATVAWFHCYSGIAGDMALGSLLDAGADLAEVTGLLERLPFSGWALEAEPVMRCGLGATHAVVKAEATPIVRTHAHIVGLIEEARLPARVRDRALAVFAALARVEGRLHRRPPAQVHFHEVGGIDAIVDIVGTCAALEVLDIDRVTASAVATGTGMVRTAHGLLPNPAPAVVALLEGAPTYGRDVSLELTTPTGAAVLAALAEGFGPLPAMTPSATGYGAGSRDLDGMPNTTQVVVGQARVAAGPGRDGGPSQPAVLIETNVDDVTGETLAHTVARLIEEGAADAWVVPIVMKKGRPAFTVCAVADVALAGSLAALLMAETGSFGVRGRPIDRWPAVREEHEVAVEGHRVRVKVGPGRAKVEHDDAARVARLTGLPLREVVAGAEAAHRHLHRVTDRPDDPA